MRLGRPLLLMGGLAAAALLAAGAWAVWHPREPDWRRLVEERFGRKVAELHRDPAAALGLEPGAVLNRAAFHRGAVGRETFHGGQVLLWRESPREVWAGAVLDLGGGRWQAAAARSGLVHDADRTLAGTGALLNDVTPGERRVPLYAFFGVVNHPEVHRVRVDVGDPVLYLEAPVVNGTWLVVYQGMLPAGPDHLAVAVALDAAGREVARAELAVQPH